MGRIHANLEGVYGIKETGPVYSSILYAGNGVGLMFVPPEGAHVWIEFERGDPSKPIYSGCFWNTKDEVPNDDDFSYPDSKMIKTEFATVILDAFSSNNNEKQKIIIKTNNSSKITITENEIKLELQQSTIQLNSSSVTVNGDAGTAALEVKTVLTFFLLFFVVFIK